jgi:signal transduction histidine kinase
MMGFVTAPLNWKTLNDNPYHKDITNLLSELNEEINFSEHTPYTQYIFGLWNEVINHYANSGNYSAALNELKKYQSKAIELKSTYGIGSSYSKYGDIYSILNNHKESIGQFKKAIDYYISINETKDLYDIYSRLGQQYMMLDDYAQAEKYSLQALSSAPTEESKINMYLALADLYISKGETDNADASLKSLDKLGKKFRLSYVQQNTKNILLIRYYIRIKDYDRALEILDSNVNSKSTQSKYKYMICKQRNDYEKALSYYEDYRRFTNERLNKIQADQLAKYSESLENDRLGMEKKELMLKNAQLSIRDLQAAQKILTMEQAHNQLQLANAKLAVDNKNLQIISQRAKTEMQRAEVKRQQEKSALLATQIHSKHQTDILIIVFLLIGFILALFYFIFSILQSRKIEHEMQKEAFARKDAQKAMNEAEEANKRKTQFLQDMSHEIRTPLNAIVGFTEVISDPSEELSQEDRTQYLDLIHSNSKLLTTLINDILDLSKMESGAYKTVVTPVNLSDLCEEIVHSFSDKHNPHVKLLLDLPSNSIFINTDRNKLTQLIDNLMSNSCKFTNKGKIVLSYMQDGDNIMFAVTDTGCGISPENSEKIFNNFEKLDTFKQGVGLGLNLCRQIAKLLNGKIFLDTTYTGGARFVFIHPITSHS